MNVRRSAIIPLLILFLSSNLVYGYAQDIDDRILSQVTYEYGSEITFSGSIPTSLEVARAALFIRTENGETTRFLEAEVIPTPGNLNIEASLDLRQFSIPPFDLVHYWWQIDFTEGTTVLSSEQTFRYEDNRFQWLESSEEQINIHLVPNLAELRDDLMGITKESMNSIRDTLGLPMPESVDIYIYPSTGDLQSSIRIGGAPWTGAHTLPEFGVILLVATDTRESIIALERDLPHELTHLMLFKKTGTAYVNLPSWLSEGLATLQERHPNPAYRYELDLAVEANTLLAMESLCANFPVSEKDALLAYAQSASFTQYLLDVYGMGGILILLDTYQEGASCTGGVQRVYQRPLTQLESEWQSVHLQTPSITQRLTPLLPWGLVLLIVILLVLIGILTRLRSRSSR